MKHEHDKTLEILCKNTKTISTPWKTPTGYTVLRLNQHNYCQTCEHYWNYGTPYCMKPHENYHFKGKRILT